MGVFLLLSISTQSLGWEVSVPATVQSSKYGCTAVRFPGHREMDRSVPSNPRERMEAKDLHGRTAMRNFLLFWARGKAAFPGALGLNVDLSFLQHCPGVALFTFSPSETR